MIKNILNLIFLLFSIYFSNFNHVNRKYLKLARIDIHVTCFAMKFFTCMYFGFSGIPPPVRIYVEFGYAGWHANIEPNHEAGYQMVSDEGKYNGHW